MPRNALLAEEALLVEGLKARSADAWTALYDEHHAALHRYVRVRTGDALVADDITAQVFEEAIKGIRGYRHQGKPILAWLYRIARNRLSDHFKQSGRTQAQPLSARRELVAAGTGVLVTGAESTRRSGDPAGDVHLLDLRNALLRLKDAHREVLALHYYVGLPLPEVAVMLGKKERAVYSLHARAIEALRRQVEEISR